MGAILNGLALSKLRAFGSSFLIFSDYMKPPIRLAALMGLPGDLCLHARLHRRRRGRTNASADRATRRAAHDPRPHHAPPADANEVVEAWRSSSGSGPARLPGAEPAGAADLRSRPLRIGIRLEARRLCSRRRQEADADVILIGTGSEVALCIGAYEEL